MKMNPFLYRCRMCGGIDDSCGGGADPLMTVINAIMGTPKEPQAPGMLTVHTCGDRVYGVADFIGSKPDETTL